MEKENSDGLLLDTAGRMTAVDFALKVLIATHPDREKFAAIWREQVTLLVDAGYENVWYRTYPAFQAGMQAQLRRLSVFVEDIP